MAYVPAVVAVAATGTLIWETSTGTAPDDALGAPVYPAGTPSDPRPIVVIVPSGSTLVPVGAVGGTPLAGASGFVGPVSIPFNVTGNDKFIGAISGTGNVTVLVGRL